MTITQHDEIEDTLLKYKTLNTKIVQLSNTVYQSLKLNIQYNKYINDKSKLLETEKIE